LSHLPRCLHKYAARCCSYTGRFYWSVNILLQAGANLGLGRLGSCLGR